MRVKTHIIQREFDLLETLLLGMRCTRFMSSKQDAMRVERGSEGPNACPGPD